MITSKKHFKKSGERNWESCQFLTDMRESAPYHQEELASIIEKDGCYTKVNWTGSVINTIETSFPSPLQVERAKHVVKNLGVSLDKYLELVEKDKLEKKARKIQALRKSEAANTESERSHESAENLNKNVDSVITKQIKQQDFSDIQEVHLSVPVSQIESILEVIHEGLCPAVRFDPKNPNAQDMIDQGNKIVVARLEQTGLMVRKILQSNEGPNIGLKTGDVCDQVDSCS